ncbi:MAG: hypothetical protein JNJ50_00115 [Acidobacteria bacterium]|nr:hypothetical protein [Acidobacteriota bacterium]
MRRSLTGWLQPAWKSVAFSCLALALCLSLVPGKQAAMADQDDRSAEVVGPIVSLPNTTNFIGDWTVGRIKVKVADTTKIDQTRGKVAVGSVVKAKGAKQNDGSIVATQIEVLMSLPSGIETKYSGKIEELPSTPGRVGDWKVSGKVIHVSAATKIEQERGPVAVGAMVIIEGLLQTDGSINALEIEVLPDVSNGLRFRFTGRVEKLPEASTRVGDWVVSGRLVKVTATTQLKQDKGQAMIGSLVEVDGLLQNDRSVIANSVEVKLAELPTITVNFRGVIETLPSATGFIGDWKVSGRTVRVSQDTKIDEDDGKVAVGATVEIKGTLQADSSVKASSVEVKTAPQLPGFIRFAGKVVSLPPSSGGTQTLIGDWKVGERTVHVVAATKIEQEKGRVAVGALVEVEGKLRDDRSVDATKIEVKHVFNDTANYVRFYGAISALPTGSLIGDWTVGGKTIHVAERTRIRQEHGAPRVGAFVEVEGNQRTDGSVDAFQIEVERDATAPTGTVGFINFYGSVKTLPTAQNFVGDWTVADKTVHVVAETKLETQRGQIAVNAFVEVYGYLLGDGSVRATKIQVRPVPPTGNAAVNRSFVEFIGTVTKLPDTTNYVGDWVVGGRTVHVERRTNIQRERAAVALGVSVEVYGAELPDGTVDAKLIEVEHGPAGSSFVTFEPLASVSASSYLGEAAANTIIASFGSNLAGGIETVKSLPLPTTLGGTSVLIDGKPAGLFFVSPTQINYLVPEDVLPGVAQVMVMRNGNVVAQGSLNVGVAAPGLFTADSSGKGAPAGLLLRVAANGQQTYEPLARYLAGQNKFEPVTITRRAGERLFLIIFGSGFSQADDMDGNALNGVAENVQVTIGTANAPVIFAGKAPGFVGLDQINAEIPTGVTGANLTVTVKVNDGAGKVLRANGLTISIQ